MRRSTYQFFLFGLTMALMAPRAHSAEIPCENIAAGTTFEVLADLGAIASNAIRSASRKNIWNGSVMSGQLQKTEALLVLAIARVEEPTHLASLLQEVRIALIRNESSDRFTFGEIKSTFFPVQALIEPLMKSPAITKELAPKGNGEVASETEKSNEYLANAFRQVSLTQKKIRDERASPPKVPKGTNEDVAIFSRFQGHIDDNLSTVDQALVYAKTARGIYALKRAKTNLQFHQSVIVGGKSFDFLYSSPVFDDLYADVLEAVKAEGI